MFPRWIVGKSDQGESGGEYGEWYKVACAEIGCSHQRNRLLGGNLGHQEKAENMPEVETMKNCVGGRRDKCVVAHDYGTN